MNFNFKNLDFAQSKKLLQFAIENRMIENLDIDSIHPLLALENASLLNLSEDQIDSIFDRSENKEEVIRISSITTDKMHKWCADMAISENDIKVIKLNAFNPELTLKKGIYTKIKPSNSDKKEIFKGIKISNSLKTNLFILPPSSGNRSNFNLSVASFMTFE